MDTLEKRYPDPCINRQFWLADAIIHFKSYQWSCIDAVAAHCSEAEVAAFCKIVGMLNAKPPERMTTDDLRRTYGGYVAKLIESER